jgi:LuxR family maltose regulon positive regulatory protein
LQNQSNKQYTKEEIKNFHNKASDWFVKNEYISEGIHHAIKANNLSKAKEIIEKNWVSALNNEKWGIVQSWLTFIPDKIIEHSISLLILKAQIYYIRNRLIDIPPILNHIKQLEQNPNDLEEGSIASFQSILSFINGDGKEALDFSEKALKLIPLEHNRFRSDEESWWALSMHMVGKMDHAIKKINTIIKNLYPPGEPIRLSRLMAQKIMISLLDADLSTAEYNIKDFEKIKGLNTYPHTFGEYFRACIGWWKYRLFNVINEFDSVITNRFYVEASLGLDAFIAKAHALMELNRPEEAIEVMDKALEYADDTKIEYNITIIKSGYARIALLQGDIDSAENWFDTIRVPEINPFVLFWVEVPAITYCRLLIAKGSDTDLNKALKLLAEYRLKVESWHNNLRTLEITSLQALANQKMGNQEQALEDLKWSIELSSKSELIRPIVELGDPIIQVLKLLKNENVQPEYIDKIIYNIENRVSKKSPLQKSTPFNGSINVRPKKSETLSLREMEIIELVSKGYRNKEIARKLYVEEVTIKKHLYNIFQKLQVKNRIELANKAKELDILESN